MPPRCCKHLRGLWFCQSSENLPANGNDLNDRRNAWVMSEAIRMRYMESRAIPKIANIAQPQRNVVIAEGLTVIAEHVEALKAAWTDHQQLPHRRGIDALGALAAEEAAKFMIMLDAVRFGTQDSQTVFRQLQRTNDHLAKGIYAEFYEHRHFPFSEVVECVSEQRKAYYLDGPNDVDWIFRNSIESEREERMYVDFVISDGDAEGHWWSPSRFDDIFMPMWMWSIANLILALCRAGVASDAGLGVARQYWHDIDVDASARIEFLDGKCTGPVDDRQERSVGMLDEMTRVGLSSPEFSTADRHLIVDLLTFPLNTVDMSKPNDKEKKITRAELRDRQRRHREQQEM